MDDQINFNNPPPDDETPTPSSSGTLPSNDPGSLPAPPPVIPHDVADQALGMTGSRSIHQRIRLLNNQQRLAVELMLAGLEPREALKRAGYASDGPLKTIQSKMPELMARVGLTDEYLINERLKPLLVAEETKFFKTTQDVVEIEYVDGAPVKHERKELVIEQRNVIANDIRLRALDMAFKLTGSYAQRNAGLDETPGADGEPMKINVNIIHVGG